MRFFGLLFIVLLSKVGLAQVDSVAHTQANVVRRTHRDYDEEIMYYGKHDRYFTVRVLRKDGTLFRSDSYEMLPSVLSGGFPLDSIHRISPYGPTKIMHPNGRVYVSCEYKDGLLQGPFLVFYEDGSIKRREYYKAGHVRQSQCYGPEGGKQTCEPFYQSPEFLGKSADLSQYLKQQVGPVIDGERVRSVTATLTINEIGQVVSIDASANANSFAGNQVYVATSRMRQAIQNMPEWTPNRLNWKPARNDGTAMPSTCIIRVYRYQGVLGYTMGFRL